MAFATPIFLSVFLPLSFGLCFLLRKNLTAQGYCLTALSLVFFAWSRPMLLLVPLLLAALGFFLGKGMARAQTPSQKRRIAWLGVGIPLALLLGFKYPGFLTQNLNAVFSWGLSVPRFVQPLGLSFFTFKVISYVLDLRSEKAAPADTYFDVLLYLCLFPALTSGPISKWQDFHSQLQRRSITLEGVKSSCLRFVWGLSKKVLLADVLSEIVLAAFGCPADARGGAFAWLGAVAFTLQLYLDFSGYCDMAIGIGGMLGFSFPENFDRPLRASSLRAFWQRWHISLMQWFHEYLYIPLGGSRGSLLKTCRNLAIVFLCSGLWHGASWTFVVWGAWNGLFLILERTRVLRPAKWPKFLAHGYTLVVVVLGFVIFRADTLPQVFSYMKSLFSVSPMIGVMKGYLFEQLTPMHVTALVLSLGMAFRPFQRPWLALRQRPWARAAGAVLCCALLVLCYAAILSSGFRPFLYASF